MGSLPVDVTPVLEVLGAEVALDAEYEMGDLVVGDETFRPAGPVRVRVSVTNTGAGFVAAGDAEAPVIAQCARCLRDFDMTLTGDIEGFFVLHGHEHSLPDEQEYGFVENGSVDIGPAIDAALALDAPFAPLHSPDCKGLCPECGADLDRAPCECVPGTTAPKPFDVLKDLIAAEPVEDADAD